MAAVPASGRCAPAPGLCGGPVIQSCAKRRRRLRSNRPRDAYAAGRPSRLRRRAAMNARFPAITCRTVRPSRVFSERRGTGRWPQSRDPQRDMLPACAGRSRESTSAASAEASDSRRERYWARLRTHKRSGERIDAGYVGVIASGASYTRLTTAATRAGCSRSCNSCSSPSSAPDAGICATSPAHSAQPSRSQMRYACSVFARTAWVSAGRSLTLLAAILIGSRPGRTAVRIGPTVMVRSESRGRGQLGWLCGQHHHGEGACIIDRPASRR